MFTVLKKILNKLPKRLVLTIILLCLVFGVITAKRLINPKIDQNQSFIESPSPGLSTNFYQDYTPTLFIHGGIDSYGNGGVITIASSDEPSVNIGGANIDGEVDVFLYQASEDDLLDYLTHDKEGKQTKLKGLSSRLTLVTKITQPISSIEGNNNKTLLPLTETGIWYINVRYPGAEDQDSMIVRSNIGALLKKGDNEFIFWGQSFKTKRSIQNSSLTLYNLTNSKNKLTELNFNEEGVATTTINPEADIALIKQGADLTVLPINLRYLGSSYGYKTFINKTRKSKYFIFTDRPLYKPGDTVYFKSILRDDDDARYTIPSGEALVKMYNGYEETDVVYEKRLAMSAEGTVFGEYKLPQNTKTGSYRLVVSLPGSTDNEANFDVQFFRKPEYSVEVSVPQQELIAGDKQSFKISANYFSGQPVVNQKVKYVIYSGDFYEYDYITDRRASILTDSYRYGYWSGEQLLSGEAILNTIGEAEVGLEAKIPEGKHKPQVYSVEATLDNGSGNPSFSRRNILIYPGDYGIFRQTGQYGTKVNAPFIMPLSLVPYRDAKIANIPLTAKVKRENWLPYQEQDKKYPSYQKEEEVLPNVILNTDDKGEAVFRFTPKKVGSYTITLEGHDGKGNLISKEFFTYASSDNEFVYTGESASQISITADKTRFEPDGVAKFTITSAFDNRDVFLSLERDRVNRYKIIHINGKSTEVEVPLVVSDAPNIFAKASSFSGHNLDNSDIKVVVSTEGKRIVVSVTPDAKKYSPGDNISLNIQTTDVKGTPVSADTAVWAVDKALFELTDNRLNDVFDTFWHERYDNTTQTHSLEGIKIYGAERGGGCFAKGTNILVGQNKLKAIEDIKAGDFVLSKSLIDGTLQKGKVSGTHKTTVNGYLIINRLLKITTNHILRLNNRWDEAGNIQIGDSLTDTQGNNILVKSIEWQQGKFEVYNLTIDKYHNFFAEGFLVHNDKGSPRELFKDTAYWNPSVRTDENGRAKITFKLPDNLTTWVISGVAVTAETKVGQTFSEVIVSKDVIVRPILPNLLRVGDKPIISALVQNFTENNKTFDINLNFDSGLISDPKKSGVNIKAGDMKEVFWGLNPDRENEKSKLVFSAATADKLNDTITSTLPVKQFEFKEKKAEFFEGNKDYKIALSKDANLNKTKITLSLSPVLIGSLPSAIKYLIDYPYGCVEQTTSRLVPVILAKLNPEIFADVIKNKNLDDMMEKGFNRLSFMQNYDGGWSWWNFGQADYFISSYVSEYLLLAKQSGLDVDLKLLNHAKSFFEQEKNSLSDDEVVIRAYALNLFNSKVVVPRLGDLTNLSSDILALAVMTNLKYGDNNPDTNGLNLLISKATPQGSALYWEAGKDIRFGSREASTALAVRAILASGSNKDIAAKGIRYIIKNRKYDYWSNTFGTVQSARAIVEYTKSNEETAPDFEYNVLLDGKNIASGKILDTKSLIKDINVDSGNIKSNGSILSIQKNGSGQIYSGVVIDEVRTDRNAKALNHGLSVTKVYRSEKGDGYSIGVGDIVEVEITVEGVNGETLYGVIEDELPAGFVPINQSFKNEQLNQFNNDLSSLSGIINQDITENGVVLSVYRFYPGKQLFRYKARAISEGQFISPPAVVSLMYSPEVFGRSEVETINIDREAKLRPEKILENPQLISVKSETRIFILIAFAVLLGGGMFLVYWMKHRR